MYFSHVFSHVSHYLEGYGNGSDFPSLAEAGIFICELLQQCRRGFGLGHGVGADQSYIDRWFMVTHLINGLV